jgi:hypothetical protein
MTLLDPRQIARANAEGRLPAASPPLLWNDVPARAGTAGPAHAHAAVAKSAHEHNPPAVLE